MATRSDDWRERDGRCLWHPYTRRSSLEEEPLPVVTRGEGVYLYDVDGNRYFDAISSWWACNLGHGHPRLVGAIARQARELQHSILGNMTHPLAVELAERLAALFPARPRRVVFASDGASAVEAALRIAVQYWSNRGAAGKNRFASMRDAYHGDTLGAVSVGYLEAFHRPLRPLLFPVHRAESPCCGICSRGAEPDSCDLDCFDSMEKIIHGHAGELAAVIVEPLCQASAGMRIYSPRYLAALRELCSEEDVLLIVDEIAMGFGRTGMMFASDHAGIDPDIVCLGKGLSGGTLPISAAVVAEQVYETFGDCPDDHTFYHGHTFAGNPIAAAAAVETLKVYAEEGIVDRARRLGGVMEAAMAELRALPGVADVRCLGALGAVELGEGPSDPSGARLARGVRREMLKKGVLVRPLGNVVYLMPPLVTPADLLRETAALLGEAVGTAGGVGV